MSAGINIGISTKGLEKYKKDLQKMHKSSYPIAVRNTLNNAAFDMKKDTFQKSAKKNFKGLKSPQFFKRFSGVDKAKGFDVKSMKSKMGLVNMGNKAARKAIEEMPKHEVSGIVQDGFAYLKAARSGNNLNKFVRKANYYDKSKVVTGRSKQARGKGTRKSKFVARAFRAHAEKKPFFMNSMRGNFLVYVTSIKKKGRDEVKINSRLLMKQRGAVRIKANHFVSEAGQDTQKKMPKLYQDEFGKQLKKYT